MDEAARIRAQILAEEASREARQELDAIMSDMQQRANAIYVQAANQAALRASKVGREQALREAVAGMASKGVSAYSYDRKDGVHVEVPADVGVRRVINDVMRNRRIRQIVDIARQTGSNLVEVGRTANARKSHEAWQGKVYMLDGSSAEYPNFYEACHVGDPVHGIGGYNCGHSVAIYHEGLPRAFGDPLEGTDYDVSEVRRLTSQQRQLENEVRKAKRVREVMKGVGLDTREESKRIRILGERLQALIDANPDVLRRRKGYREAIAPILRKQKGAVGIVHLGKAEQARIEGLAFARMQRDEWAKRNLKLNKGNQEKHIPGTAQFDAKRAKVERETGYPMQSWLTITAQECEDIIRRYAGTGIVTFSHSGEWDGRETCKADREIGFYVDADGVEHQTAWFKIHYGKGGLHIVPFAGPR